MSLQNFKAYWFIIWTGWTDDECPFRHKEFTDIIANKCICPFSRHDDSGHISLADMAEKSDAGNQTLCSAAFITLKAWRCCQPLLWYQTVTNCDRFSGFVRCQKLICTSNLICQSKAFWWTNHCQLFSPTCHGDTRLNNSGFMVRGFEWTQDIYSLGGIWFILLDIDITISVLIFQSFCSDFPWLL